MLFKTTEQYHFKNTELLAPQIDNSTMRLAGSLWIERIWLRLADLAGSCERGNEPSGYIKCGEFPD